MKNTVKNRKGRKQGCKNRQIPLQNNVISRNLVLRRFHNYDIILLQVIVWRQHDIGICKVQPRPGSFIVRLPDDC